MLTNDITIQSNEFICFSTIYCKGTAIKNANTTEESLLHMVQLLKVYNDGITFVQKEMLSPEADILEEFAELKKNLSIRNLNITKEILKEFVDKNFIDDSLEKVNLVDFKPEPAIMSKVNDAARKWLSELNCLWKDFARKVPKKNENNSSMSSMMYVPNTFIIAGIRFKGKIELLLG